MNGFFNLYKPSGMTSALLVHLVKKKTGAKCGHMGTLDPMASGVLPVGIGKANRLFEYLLDKEKEYAAEFTFGAETDTLDKTGAVTQTSEYLPAREELEALLPRFVGEIEQVPPRYSAKNVGGRRPHELTMKIQDDGTIQYVGNRILDNGIANIPRYQYRLGNLQN